VPSALGVNTTNLGPAGTRKKKGLRSRSDDCTIKWSGSFRGESGESSFQESKVLSLRGNDGGGNQSRNFLSRNEVEKLLITRIGIDSKKDSTKRWKEKKDYKGAKNWANKEKKTKQRGGSIKGA